MASTDQRIHHELNIFDALKRTARSGSSGFFFDFDGVLAPIQLDPETVQPTPGVAESLALLAPLVQRIAIVSARPMQYLLRHFSDLPAVSLYGLYGLESRVAGVVTIDPAAEAWIPVIRTVRLQAEQQLPNGVYVEDKRLSVSLHYRQHPEFQLEVEDWAGAKASEFGLTEQRGRMVVELKPPVSVDKGTVLRGETSDLKSAWYFGDDISDAKGFQALRERTQLVPGFFGVCVAVHNSETGHALQQQADFTLDSPADLPGLINRGVEIFLQQ